MRIISTLFLLITLMATSSSFPAHAMDPEAREKIFTALARGTPHVKNEVLIQFSPTATAQDKTRVLLRIRAEKLETISGPSAQRSAAPSAQGDLDRVKLPVGLSVADAIRGIENDSGVVFAEPNWIYQHQLTPNDTYFNNGNTLWGMTGTNGSKASVAWDKKTDCSSTYVGIIDEGYFFNHADLKANAGINPGEIAGNAIDDDKNGYVDDVYGWDFDGNNNTVFDGRTDDHGTHVAGTIGGVGDNQIGVAGVCWKIKFLSAKFLGRNGGTTANAIRAVNYLTDLKTMHGLNLVATNNSWGGGGFSQGLADAIAAAGSAEILFIAAAGNNTYDCDTSASCYPAEYTNNNIISVASLNSNGTRSSFSNYGKTTVDLGAPGSGILSTVPTNCSGTNCQSGYASYSGTSMATPHVTGAVALYKSINPTASSANTKTAILGKSTSISSMSPTVTGGRLDMSGF